MNKPNPNPFSKIKILFQYQAEKKKTGNPKLISIIMHRDNQFVTRKKGKKPKEKQFCVALGTLPSEATQAKASCKVERTKKV